MLLVCCSWSLFSFFMWLNVTSHSMKINILNPNSLEAGDSKIIHFPQWQRWKIKTRESQTSNFEKQKCQPTRTDTVCPYLMKLFATSTWLSQAVVYNLGPVYSIFLYFSGYFSGGFFSFFWRKCFINPRRCQVVKKMPHSLVYSRQRREAADELGCNGEMICRSCSDVHSETRDVSMDTQMFRKKNLVPCVRECVSVCVCV